MEDLDLGIGSRVKHPEFGDGVVVNIKSRTYTIVFMRSGKIEVSKNANALEIVERIEPDTDMVSMLEIERVLTNIIKRHSDIQETVPMHGKWIGGKMSLTPGNPSLSGKIIPMESFFHKIVMLRDRLRVMEQKINANTKMNDEEKVDLQQYITRIYGSLTTFNVLFKNPEEQFIGEKGKDND